MVAVPPGLSVEEAIHRAQQSGLVQYAEPDYVCWPCALYPNDPQYGQQWALPKIQAPEAWSIQNDASQVIVAVIDTGVEYTHDDLQDNIWVNWGETGLDAQGHDKRTNGLDDDGNGYIDDVRSARVPDHGWITRNLRIPTEDGLLVYFMKNGVYEIYSYEFGEWSPWEPWVEVGDAFYTVRAVSRPWRIYYQTWINGDRK